MWQDDEDVVHEPERLALEPAIAGVEAHEPPADCVCLHNNYRLANPGAA